MKEQKNHEYRAITGTYASTTIQALISEGRLVPAQTLLDHPQKMCKYRLLTLPDHYIVKKILPINFRNRDANIICAEDQPEDTLIWAGNERPTPLIEWLACQVSVTQAVDSAYKLETKERCWRLDTELLSQVALQPRRKAL